MRSPSTFFGLEVKGLLKEEEEYSQYWSNRNVNKVVAMRAPLTYSSEAVILNLKNDEKMKEWYKYLYSGIVYNIWGKTCMYHADSDKK